ncbi:MAG TPA: FMN-binding negative transcriptional regulator, partial [Acidimicrobiia bacterium]|nr:FMN-binding negative transcriptional regulator [Acidimicrobiia bacterium]
MYLPSHFEETRIDELQRIIRDHPLGALVVAGPSGLDANHLPFELDTGEGDAGVLRTHVARANPLAGEAHDGDEALVIFRGPEAYVSPNWYPSKPETHRLVPTWNYQVVHVHGRMAIRDDVKHLRGLVARLTRTHESAAGEPTPWRMADSPAEYIDMMLAAIVGIDVVIERVVGKCKLSQNREARD